MSKVAIDIALLPPGEVMDAAIAVNKSVLAKEPTPLVLSKKSRLPHITLMQAVIDDSDMDKSKKKLNQIANHFLPIGLTAKLTVFNNQMSFDFVTGLEKLQKLHECVMKEFETLASYNSKEEYYADDYVREYSLDYVRNFKGKHAYNNYYPHITLSVGTIDLPEQRMPFTANRLAVCHLGNYNTCKDVLFEVSV